MTTEAQEIHYIIAITAKKPPQFHLLYSKKKKIQTIHKLAF